MFKIKGNHQSTEVMTENTLQNYFEGQITASQLKQDLVNSVSVKEGITRISISDSKEKEEFTISDKHLLKLLKDVELGELSTNDLNTISFCLESSEYFFWDNSTPVGERIAQLISSWTSPEINSELSDEYLQYCAFYLSTGEHT